jgi:hypothetical protein
VHSPRSLAVFVSKVKNCRSDGLGRDAGQAGTPADTKTSLIFVIMHRCTQVTLDLFPPERGEHSVWAPQEVGLRSGLMLGSIDRISKKAGKDHQEGASHLELPGPLDGDPRHHPQCLFRCAKAN